MRLSLKSILLTGLISTTAFGTAFSQAQEFPTKPITILVGTRAGGGTDSTARAVAGEMQNILGQPVLVENRVGAASQIAGKAVADAEPDGYTLLLLNNSAAVQAAINENSTFDLEKDLTSVSLLATTPLFVVAGPATEADDLQELIELAKENPGEITFGSSGAGGVTHMAGAYMGELAGVEFRHIPFTGGSAHATAVLSGEIHFAFQTGPQAVPMAEDGRGKVLAVTGSTRDEAFPDVPTVAEQGLAGYDITLWYGLVAPAGTPEDVIQKLNDAASKALEAPQVRETMLNQRLTPSPSTPEEYWKMVMGDVEKARAVAKEAEME